MTLTQTGVLTSDIHVLAHVLNLFMGLSFLMKMKCVVPGKSFIALDSSFIRNILLNQCAHQFF